MSKEDSKPSVLVETEGDRGTTNATLAPEDEALKELTAAATKVAGVAKGVAKDVQKVAAKISQRWATAVNTAVEESSPISKIVGGVSNWWANLDPTAEGGDQSGEDPATSTKMMAELHHQYGLSEDEALLEQFKCILLQPYKCADNEFTPPMQMAFPVSLSIFEHHFCFCPEHHRHRIPITLLHRQTTKVEKQDNSGDPVLSVTLEDGRTIVWKGFESDTALDRALALMEHLTE